MASFSFGSDPEFMLVDRKGKYRSAIGIVHGTKEDKVSLGNDNWAFYDNVLAEVNIKPSFTKKEAVTNFGNCFKSLANLVGDLRVVPQASQTYDLKEMDHPDSRVFGCDPEYCIYNRDAQGKVERVEPPVCEYGNSFRSGGGHIHIGHEICLPWENPEAPIKAVELLDLFIGVPSVLIDHDPTSAARRKLYGGAGTHRLKFDYGLEYRSLSNFWLASPVLVSVIYDLVDFVLDLRVADKKLNFDQNLVRKTINEGDKKTALALVDSLAKLMPEVVVKEIKRLSEPVVFDFYQEWKLA